MGGEEINNGVCNAVVQSFVIGKPFPRPITGMIVLIQCASGKHLSSSFIRQWVAFSKYLWNLLLTFHIL